MRESHIIVIWLDNLGLFYPLIDELGLMDIGERQRSKGHCVGVRLVSPTSGYHPYQPRQSHPHGVG